MKKKKPYTPFPPDQTERKIDKEMEEGKFFVEQEERKKTKKRKKTEEEQKEVQEKQKAKRAKAFVPPEEPKFVTAQPKVNSEVDIESLKKKVKKRKMTK